MQMASIYRNAETVFAWLGQSKGDYKEPRSAITQMENSPIRDGPHGVVSGIKPELYAEDHPVSHQVQDLLMRDYWKRMWIIQEIIIAGVKATLLCGEYSFRWYPIQELVKTCDNCWEQDRIGIAMRLIRIAHMSTPLPRQTTIMQLLQRLDGGGACTDLRDKVYALLGLLRDSGKLRPDYSISTEDLFFRVLQSATMSSKQSHVTFKDASILKKSLELDFKELSGHLNRKDEQIQMQESIRLGRQPSLLWPCRLSIRLFISKRVLLHGLEFRFDHDQSIRANAWVLEHTDVLFEFASFGAEDKLRKAMVLREVDPGLFKYISMAEYRDTEVLNSEVGDRCCAKERWFLYHLPALLSADCLAGEDTQIIVSSEMFLALMKLSEMGMSIGDSRVNENDLEFLGIRDGLVITHSTLFVPGKQQEGGTARDYDSTSDWDMARLEIPTYEAYDGYSELWCGSSKDQLPT